MIVTGVNRAGPTPLTPRQAQALTSTLHALTTMPDYPARHVQAGRIAATWVLSNHR